jgi:hypothetical protein
MVKEKIDILINNINQGSAYVDFSDGVKIKINDNKYQKYIVKLFYWWENEWMPFFEDIDATCGFEYDNCLKSFSWRCEIYAYENKSLNLIYSKTNKI